MMTFMVAERLGMTVRRLEAEMDMPELMEWLTYFNIQANQNATEHVQSDLVQRAIQQTRQLKKQGRE